MDKSIKIFDSEKTLSILQEIELNPHLTQRYLAQKLTLSLGKINFLIKAMADKGIIEINNFKKSKNKLGFVYMLTPHGINIKFQLIHKFLIWKIEQYNKLKEEIELLKKESSLMTVQSEKIDSVDVKEFEQLTKEV